MKDVPAHGKELDQMIFKSSFSNPNHFTILCKNSFHISKLSAPKKGPKSIGNLNSLSVVMKPSQLQCHTTMTESYLMEP